MSAEQHDTAREQLLRAGERLFARDGIHRVKLREINDLAGQRNPSAVHYHFGTREGLVDAILLHHQESIEQAMDAALDELEAGGRPVALRDVVATVVHPLVGKLETESGRDFLRIIPQVIPALSANLRQGVAAPATPQSRRVLELLRQHWGDLPEAVQRERQIAYILMLTAMLADRAHQVESGWETPLDAEAFEQHVLDMIAGASALRQVPDPSPQTPVPAPMSGHGDGRDREQRWELKTNSSTCRRSVPPPSTSWTWPATAGRRRTTWPPPSRSTRP